MSWKDTAEPILTRMPSVERPEGHVSFNEKLKWTGGILLLYFILTNVTLFGLGEGSTGLGYYQSLIGGSMGSILQLGIGPIVTASIVLQLLGGADLLGIDKNDPRDQQLYQGLQKLLTIAMAFLTGATMAFSGVFLQPSQQIAQALGVGLGMVQVLLYVQIVIGGVIILYLDEIVSKWGIGSGVGLFIIAGISQKILGGLFAVKALTGTTGVFPAWIHIALGNVKTGPIFTIAGLQKLLVGPGQVLALFTTLFIFGVVVYAESVRVEIPLSHSRMKSAAGRYPVKLIYASVLPMILVRALQSNIQIFAKTLDSMVGLPAFIAEYSNGQATAGLMYYLSPIRRPQDWMWWMASTTHEPWQIILRVGVDLSVMVFGGAIFAVFWVETTGMGPRETAEQIRQSGMQMNGFRRNSGVMATVLERYIPHVTVLGGAIVGALAVMANMLGTVGQVSGTGLLLTVSITYKLYEQIGKEKLKEMNPMIGDLLG